MPTLVPHLTGSIIVVTLVSGTLHALAVWSLVIGIVRLPTLSRPLLFHCRVKLLELAVLGHVGQLHVLPRRKQLLELRQLSRRQPLVWRELHQKRHHQFSLLERVFVRRHSLVQNAFHRLVRHHFTCKHQTKQNSHSAFICPEQCTSASSTIASSFYLLLLQWIIVCKKHFTNTAESRNRNSWKNDSSDDCQKLAATVQASRHMAVHSRHEQQW